MKKLSSFGLAALFLSAIALPASGSPLVFAGNFSNDNDVVLIPFTVPETMLVTFQTFSYGGGVNGAGQFILPGGFEPMLILFEQPSAAIVGTMYPGSSPNPCGPQIPDPNRLNLCLDVFSVLLLNPGDYLLALTQNPNENAGPNLSDGFIYDSEPQFANGFKGSINELPGDSHYALDITLSPEPGAALLMAPALLLIGVLKRRRSS